MNNQIRKDLEINPFEMVVSKQTFYVNKFMSEYDKIKKRIPSNSAVECFLYHGSRLKNHPKMIANENNNNDNDDNNNVKFSSEGYFGNGIYLTDNPFYAAIYGNKGKILRINEQAEIICCKAIYNKNKILELNDNSFYNKQINDDIKNNYGINHAIVGDSTGFLPINQIENDKNSIIANEFVFSNEFQIIPLCSFTVTHKDHFILWKDENIRNGANSKLLNEFSKITDVNIYTEDNIDDALKLMQIKRFSPFKLITNGGGEKFTGRKLIENARSLTKSNFVCLVYATLASHLEWASKMENVLFTSDENDVKKFAELKMNLNDVFAFSTQLSNKYEAYNHKFKINKDQLLNFHGT